MGAVAGVVPVHQRHAGGPLRLEKSRLENMCWPLRPDVFARSSTLV
ncbi:MAG: hypothetical protein KDJ29_18815 [Hyphomicrobiales bacterium]|nr:hypothetical protein [Hyphomicrobiales bacterium]